MRQVTLAAVAEAAGVSSATASRILSGARKGDPATAQRVRRAAADLGYTGNPIARALRHGRTANIGMTVPSIGNPFFTGLVEAIEHQLAHRGLNLFLCDSRNDVDIEARRLMSLMQGKVDGILSSPTDTVHSRKALQEAADRVPVVQVDRFIDDFDCDSVVLDDDHAMGLIVRHLHKVGVTSAAFVTSMGSSSAALRMRGVRRWSEHYGISIRADHILVGDFSLRWGSEAADRLIDVSIPDAIICSDDLLAAGMLARLAQRGYAVPRDVLVTGFDDIEMASLTSPTLTTLRQPWEQLAEQSVALLCARIDDAQAPRSNIWLQGELVVRDSTVRAAAPPAPRPDRHGPVGQPESARTHGGAT